MVTNLAHFLKLSAAPNVERAPRDGKMQDAAWANLARARGNAYAVRDELIELDREQVAQCARDQQSDF